MQKFLAGAAIGIAMFGQQARAADHGTAAEAVAMTKKAVAYIQKNGQEKAFAEFSNMSNKTFHDRDLYIFVYDAKGVARAHGSNPGMVGMNLISMRDRDGKYIIKEFIALTNGPAGKGWVAYKWPNPITDTVDNKVAYVEKAGNFIVGSGIYK